MRAAKFKPFGRLENWSSSCPWSIFPRKKLDISYSDLFSAISSCATIPESKRSDIQKELEALWTKSYDPESRQALCCLSVRTAFDMFLRLMNWPPGSEIICSAITIPDMIYLIRYHNLVPVPIDLDPKTCAVDVSLLPGLMNQKTKAVLVAHVFGTRNDINGIVDVVQEASNKIYVLEDCAQAYSGRSMATSAGGRADLSLYSFGTIKTSTAFGGAMVSVRDGKLYDDMKALNATYPVRPRSYFLKRVVKYAAVHSATSPALFGLLLHVCLKLNIPHDEVITAAIRGFSGGELTDLIRCRPSVPLLALLLRRLTNEDVEYINARRERSQALTERLQNIPGVEIPGVSAAHHYYWLYPVQVAEPERIAGLMTTQGFDVTCGATQLTSVPVDARSNVRSPVCAAEIMRSIIYLPVTPETPDWALDKLSECLSQALHGQARL